MTSNALREITLDPNWDIPIVSVLLASRKSKRTRSRLVFDTGSALTQIDVDLIENLGYSARDAVGIHSVKGAIGDAVEGYVLSVASLHLFGKELRDVTVLAYDFKNFPGIDGLLGWDLIKQLHVELDGPKGSLKLY